MESNMTPRTDDRLADPATLTQGCARAYESDLARLLLGDSFHPGGLCLTDRLGALLALTAGSVVLDVASGIGSSAIALAGRHGCRVLGLDYSRQSLVTARDAAATCGLGDRVHFGRADAEALPLADESVDVIVCECAFCTFPDKGAVAREFTRVLRPGGRLGLSDLTRSAETPTDELDGLLAWIACLGDARPLEGYAEILTEAGLSVVAVERHDETLGQLVHDIRARLLGAELLNGLGKLDLPGVDFREANRLVRAALRAIHTGRLGYALIVAARTPSVGR
jgi:SAM-dependent methyltransferase